VNRARVAALLRELAKEIEGEEDTVAPPVKPTRRRRHARPLRRPPPVEASDIDVQAARTVARQRGILEP
jgi:hypothetical protein